METTRDGRMAGKVAIVTGAGSRAEGIGNGRASSILLARHGAKVALVDENPDWVARTQSMIEAEGRAACPPRGTTSAET